MNLQTLPADVLELKRATANVERAEMLLRLHVGVLVDLLKTQERRADEGNR